MKKLCAILSIVLSLALVPVHNTQAAIGLLMVAIGVAPGVGAAIAFAGVFGAAGSIPIGLMVAGAEGSWEKGFSVFWRALALSALVLDEKTGQVEFDQAPETNEEALSLGVQLQDIQDYNGELDDVRELHSELSAELIQQFPKGVDISSSAQVEAFNSTIRQFWDKNLPSLEPGTQRVVLALSRKVNEKYSNR